MPSKGRTVITKLVLRLHRFFALLQFPGGVPRFSYVYFDRYVPLGGAHERILLYERDGTTMLRWDQVDPMQCQRQRFETTVADELRRDLFGWLRSAVPHQGRSAVFLNLCWDPVRLKVFAYDNQTGWQYSLNVHGLQRSTELRTFASDCLARLSKLKG